MKLVKGVVFIFLTMWVASHGHTAQKEVNTSDGLLRVKTKNDKY